MVLSVIKMGGDALLEIAFDDIGTKKLMAKTASAHMKRLWYFFFDAHILHRGDSMRRWLVRTVRLLLFVVFIRNGFSWEAETELEADEEEKEDIEEEVKETRFLGINV